MERRARVDAPVASTWSTPVEREYRTLFDATDGLAFLADSRRRIRWMSRTPPGRGLHRFVGRDFLELVASEQRRLVQDAADRILAGAPPVELEVQGAETRHWHRLRLVGVSERGSVQGFAVHALDIDDAKRDQTELALLRARLRDVVEGVEDLAAGDGGSTRLRFDLMADALPVLISYVDRERRYQYNNAAYERWFGTSREDLRGRDLQDVLGTSAYQGIRPYVDAALGGQSATFEMTIPYRDAGVRRVVARYVPDMTSKGEIAGFYALVEDVTARREAEDALRQREEELRQLQKMEALGRLAGGIAHEFNNLLATVITGCSTVLQSIDAESSVGRMLARVMRAAQRGASLTRALLSFSRESELRAGPLDIDALLGDLAVLLDRLLGPGLQLEVDLHAGCPIVADPGQIQQIVMNLAINARDAMPQGGRLRLATTRVDVSTEEATRHGVLDPGPYVILTVSDTGTGMDEDTRARIFDPFFTTKPPGEGTGLGLSTVYGIVQQAGGHIDVQSAPGEGTTFRLYFPISPERPRDRPAATDTA